MGIYRNFSISKNLNHNAAFLQRSLAISSGPPRPRTRDELKIAIVGMLHDIARNGVPYITNRLLEIATESRRIVTSFADKWNELHHGFAGPEDPTNPATQPARPPNQAATTFALNPPIFPHVLSPMPNLDTADLTVLETYRTELETYRNNLARYINVDVRGYHDGDLVAYRNRVGHFN